MHTVVSKIVFFICIVSIQYLATTSIEIQPIQNSWDKANHIFAFVVLYITLSFAYPKLTVLIKVIILLIYGVQIELVQSFLPYRDFSIADIIADFIGILFGVFFRNIFPR